MEIKPIRLITHAFVVLTLTFTIASISYAGCDGLEGKELKKCEKQAKAQARGTVTTTSTPTTAK